MLYIVNTISIPAHALQNKSENLDFTLYFFIPMHFRTLQATHNRNDASTLRPNTAGFDLIRTHVTVLYGTTTTFTC